MASFVFDTFMQKCREQLGWASRNPPTLYVSPTHAEWMRRYTEQPQMPKGIGYDNIQVTLDGVPVHVTGYSRSVEIDRDGVEVAIEGFISNLDRMSAPSGYARQQVSEWPGPGTINMIEYGRPGRGKTMGGSGIGVSAEDFLAQQIGGYRLEDVASYELYTGGENMREGTQGSYAYGVAQLAEGLKSAVDSGFITEDEAKTEFRLNVASVARADELAAYEKERIEALEKELAELREKQAGETS